MEITFEQIGLFLQILGVIVVLGAQIHFLLKLWKKWRNLKIGFYNMTASRFVTSNEELMKMTKEDQDEVFKDSPMTMWLRSNFFESILGLSLTVAGLLVELLIHGSIAI